MVQPRVSVVVPAKDAGAYLSDALASLTWQFDDPGRLEVIVVDDGSRDDTGRIARAYAAQLPRLAVLRNEQPVGLAEARNQGMAETTGRFLAFLDADDWLAPGHLSVTADALETLACAFVRVDHITVHRRERSLVRAPEPVRGRVISPRESILPETVTTMVDYPYAWAGMFDRALATDGLLDFPSGLHTAEDRPWIWNLHLRGPSYAVIDAPGVYYRRGLPDSLTQIYDRRQLDIVPALEGVGRVLRGDAESDRFMPKYVRTVAALAAHHLFRSGRMDPGARDDLNDGFAALVAGLPRAQVNEQLGRAPRQRAHILAALLRRGTDARRRRRRRRNAAA